MSLFQCIDLINFELSNPRKKSLIQHINHFFSSEAASKYRKILYDDNCFLVNLKNDLEQRIIHNNNNYQSLDSECTSIKDFLANNPNTTIQNTLNNILADLQEIQEEFAKARNPSTEPVDQEKKASPFDVFECYKIAEIIQSQLIGYGKSEGECLGITYSMVIPELSPYKMKHDDNWRIALNQQIHDFQKNQVIRNKDQGMIKKVRLTRNHFQADYKMQAEEIINKARQHKNKDLCLLLTMKKSCHACYLQFIEDNIIHYMDPNFGAYTFPSKEEFIAFYIVAAQVYNKSESPHRIYALNHLRLSTEQNPLKEEKTFSGKVRSFLTGRKYPIDDTKNAQLGFYIYRLLLIGLFSGIGLGAAIGVALLVQISLPLYLISLVPLSALLPVFVGGSLFMSFISIGIATSLNKSLLAIPHLLKHRWHDFKEQYFTSEPNRKLEKSILLPKANHLPGSSGMILSRLEGNNSKEGIKNTISQQPPVNQSRPITEPAQANAVDSTDFLSTTHGMKK